MTGDHLMMTLIKLNNFLFRFQRSILRKLWYIFLVVLQQAAQIMLCIKLENIGNLSLFYVMVPVWIILSASTVDVFQSLFDN